MSTKRSYLSKVVVEMPDSGIKDFFDIANTMDGALSLGVGEPDFQTPEHVREAAVASIRRAETKYTDNRGTVELRAAQFPQTDRRKRRLRSPYYVDPNGQKIPITIEDLKNSALQIIHSPKEASLPGVSPPT